MGLGGEQPLGEGKTKAPSSDYHKNESPVVEREEEVARAYLKRAGRIDELNGHPPGSDGTGLVTNSRPRWREKTLLIWRRECS